MEWEAGAVEWEAGAAEWEAGAAVRGNRPGCWSGDHDGGRQQPGKQQAFLCYLG